MKQVEHAPKSSEKVADSLAFVDFFSVRSHVRLNHFYLRFAELQSAHIYVSEELFDEYKGANLHSLGRFACSGKFSRRFGTAIRLLYLIAYLRPNKVVFLSYDLVSMWVLSNFLMLFGIKIVLFEHNTYPTGFLKLLAHKLIGNRVLRLVFTNYLQRDYTELGLKSCEIAHPIPEPTQSVEIDRKYRAYLDSQFSQTKDFLGFCPSSSVHIDYVLDFSRKCKSLNLFAKGNELQSTEDVICRNYFDDYNSVLLASDFVYIPFDLSTKVSGPVFDALSIGKPVILKRNRFGRYVCEAFPGSVLFDDVCEDALYSFLDSFDQRIPLQNWNKDISDKFYNLVIRGIEHS